MPYINALFSAQSEFIVNRPKVKADIGVIQSLTGIRITAKVKASPSQADSESDREDFLGLCYSNLQDFHEYDGCLL